MPANDCVGRLGFLFLAASLLTLLEHAQGANTFSEQGFAVLGGANFNSRSASAADIDNDGDLDLMFQGAAGSQQLLRSNFADTGILTYTNVSRTLPVGLGPSWSAAWGDYDGDGNVDVLRRAIQYRRHGRRATWQ